jgi:hypothetical protein
MTNSPVFVCGDVASARSVAYQQVTEHSVQQAWIQHLPALMLMVLIWAWHRVVWSSRPY